VGPAIAATAASPVHVADREFYLAAPRRNSGRSGSSSAHLATNSILPNAVLGVPSGWSAATGEWLELESTKFDDKTPLPFKRAAATDDAAAAQRLRDVLPGRRLEEGQPLPGYLEFFWPPRRVAWSAESEQRRDAYELTLAKGLRGEASERGAMPGQRD